MSAPSFDEARRAAAQALDAGDARAAFGHVRFHLGHDAALTTDGALWREAFALFARIAEGIAGDDFAALVRRAADAPDDVQGLYDLGYELIEQGLPGIAATALARANLLYPGQESIVTELAVALESDFRCHEAAAVLRQAGGLLEQSYLCRYLLAYNALMTGDLDEPRRLLPALTTDGPDQRALADRIAGMLARADAVRGVTSLNTDDLRGWHFVVTGGLLLHLSPHGMDCMRGRYAYTQDSPDRCLEGLRRLAAVFDAWQVRPARVWRLPDDDSAALALAAGQVFGCPVQAWHGGAGEGLVGVYDLSTADGEVAAALAEHRPGQVVWSHASCWTQEPPLAADLTTYLYQYNVSPWGEGMRLDDKTHKVVKSPPATSPAEQRAAQVTAATLEADALADVAALAELARAARGLTGEHGPGAFRGEGRRRRQGTNSPVPSNRFT
jgi:hypothetical protein